MKRFRFPLRPVAVIRAHRELRAREALAIAIHAYVQSEESLAAVRGRIRELESIISDGRRERFRAGDAVAFHQAYRRERAAEAEGEKQMAAAREAMEKRREAYIEANREVKAVGRLEDRARAAHQLAGLRSEQLELDEIAVLRAGRGNLQS